MPKQIIEDNIWKDRLKNADTYYKTWENLFKCKILENYYEGRQWADESAENYVINKIYETIQIQISQFIPTFPKFLVSPRPANSDFDLENAALSAQLKEDVVNTFVRDERGHFREEIELAYKDSKFRFGMMEVGYSADWKENPNAPRALLQGDVDKQTYGKDRYKIKDQPEKLPYNERIYFKHIGARRFRVGGIDHKYLDRCSWYGYYEWVDKNDLLALKIMNRDKVELSFDGTNDEYTEDQADDKSYRIASCKVWHIWDNKAKVRLMLLNDPCVTLFQRKFDRRCLFDYRPDRRLSTEGFYPVPPVYHWISAQDEINETRQQFRNHRRRYIRKFQIREGLIDDVEIEKFEDDVDGRLIKVKEINAISAIQDANLGPAADKATATSADDLNKISGTSSEARGVADRTTATAATITDTRSKMRENSERDRIVAWMSGMGREAIQLAQEKFTLGVWAELTSDTPQTLGSELQANQYPYQLVTSEQLNDGYDFRIDVDVTSLSVAAQEDEKKRFLEFLTIVTQFQQIAFSPILIREAAYRVGYRNEKVIKEMQTMALVATLGMGGGGGQQGGAPSSDTISQNLNARSTPPTRDQVGNQINQQLLQ